MRRLYFLASCALLALLFPMMMLAAAASAGDEQPIKDRLNEFQNAWNKEDTAAMAALWAEDGTLINPFGVTAQGRDAMIKVFTQEHAGPFKNTKYSVSEMKIQWVTPDVAIVDATANITGVRAADGSSAPDFPHHVTWVFVKKDGKWMAAAARPYQFAVKQ